MSGLSLMAKYHNLDLGLADASVIAVAERIGTDRIFTVDLRDFRVIRSATANRFGSCQALAQIDFVGFLAALHALRHNP